MMGDGGVHEWGRSGRFGVVALGGVEVDEAGTATDDGFFSSGDEYGPVVRGIEEDAGEFGEGIFVEAIENFVEEEKARAGNDGACDEEADPLAAGERETTGEEGRVDAFGEVENILEEADAAECGIDVVDGDVGAPEADVVCDGTVDEIGAANQGDLGAETFQIPATEVELIDDDVAI